MRLVPNPNFEREIEREVEFRKGKIEYAEAAKAIAVANAPVGRPSQYSRRRLEGNDPKMKPGAYKRALVKDGVHVEGVHVYLRATDWKGHWVEWGSVNNRARHVLRNAVLAIGLRLKEDKKGSRAIRHTARQPIRGFDSAVLRNVPG